MTRRRARWSRLLVLGVLAVLLAGCVSLPDGSPVTQAKGAGIHRERELQRFSPSGPEPNAPQRAIVQGYLTAMLGFPSDPAKVREFMTPTAARTWNPEDRLQVYEGPSVVDTLNGVELDATLLGSVDQRGSWSSTTGAGANLKLALRLTKVAGQWRIENPEPGTLLDTYFFNLYYHEYSLYFWDPTFSVVAPDQVYLQLGSPGAMATSLVHDLLLGPTSDMYDVVRSAAPPGTTLTSRVTVASNGYADVPLSGGVLSLTASQRQSLAVQLAWTLRQELVGVNHIRMTVGGRALVVQTAGSVFSVDKFRDRSITPGSSTLYGLTSGGRLYTVTLDGVVSAASGPLGQTTTDARSVAVNGPGDFAALVSKDGTKVIAGSPTLTPGASAPKVWFRGGQDLLRPSWDASGLLWLIDRREHGAVLEVTRGSTHSVVDAPGIAGEDVQAFALSRDGMRLAAVIGRGANSQLVVAMIKRDANTQRLTDVSLVGKRNITNYDFPLSDITGLAWANATTVVVLAQDGSSQSKPYEVSIDGSHVEASSGFLPTGPVNELAAGAGSGVPLVIGSVAGRLFFFQTQEQQWSLLSKTPRLSAPVYPS